MSALDTYEVRDSDPGWMERAVEMRRGGRTYAAIARELDAPYEQVYYRLKRANQEWDPKTQKCEVCGTPIRARMKGACAPCKRKALSEKVTCKVCEETFYVTQSEARKREPKYCSRKCFYAEMPQREAAFREKMSKARRGKNNPFYKNGKHVGRKTQEITREFNLKKKGESECRNCPAPAAHAHHAVPRSVTKLGHTDLRNCLPLCASCHMGWHRGNYITRDRFTREEWEFLKTMVGPSWLNTKYPEPEDRWQFRGEKDATGEPLPW